MAAFYPAAAAAMMWITRCDSLDWFGQRRNYRVKTAANPPHFPAPALAVRHGHKLKNVYKTA
jgi:hypothetical protein